MDEHEIAARITHWTNHMLKDFEIFTVIELHY